MSAWEEFFWSEPVFTYRPPGDFFFDDLVAALAERR
jgi:hypothetical protein